MHATLFKFGYTKYAENYVSTFHFATVHYFVFVVYNKNIVKYN